MVNQSARIREIDVTSYAEIVLAPPADDLAHPAFGKLFLETEYLRRQRGAALPSAAARSATSRRCGRCTSLSLEGRPQGPVEWETDRARFLGRGRDTDDPVALDGRALSGTTGVVLDPILSLRQRIRLAPGASVRLCFATGIASDRETAEALAQKYRDPSAASRAPSRSPSRTRRAACATWAFRTTRRCCSSAWRRACCAPTARCARRRRRSRPNELGQAGLWPHGISGDLPILLVRVVGDDDVALVRQVLQAQEYWRLKGLSADVVILNEHPVSYLDEMHAQLTALLDDGPWRTWKHRPGGAYLLRGDRMGSAERTLLEAVARAVLGGDRGDLRAQLDRPHRRCRQRRAGVRRGRRRRARRDRRPARRCAAARDDAGQRPRRLHRRRPRLRDRPRGRPGNAAAVGERHRQPALRHHRHRVGRGAHLVGEQPREPADAVRQRSGRAIRRPRRSSFATTTSGDAWSPTPGPMRAAPRAAGSSSATPPA